MFTEQSGAVELTPRNLTPRNLTPKNLTPKNLTPKNLTPKNLTPKNLTPKNLGRENLPRGLTPKPHRSESDLTNVISSETVPILLVCSAAVLLLGGVLFCFCRRPFTPSQWLLYYINLLVAHLIWRIKLSRHLPLPSDQGVVIIANHRSSIDPCLIQVAAGHRVVHWMVAQLYGQGSLIAWMMKTVEIIPVQRRGGDVSPTKAAIRLAAEGEPVGMLPEGTINTTDEFMLPVRPGAVLVALKARVPILPCYIEGAPYHDVAWKPVFMRARVRVKVGELVDLSDYYGREGEEGVLNQLTLDCVREIAKLAGRDDFEPRIAGRDWKTWQ